MMEPRNANEEHETARLSMTTLSMPLVMHHESSLASCKAWAAAGHGHHETTQVAGRGSSQVPSSVGNAGLPMTPAHDLQFPMMKKESNVIV